MKSEENYCGSDVYHGEQAREVVRYVREEYGCELEFLWQDGNGVWRNPGNRKWFGVMMKVKGERLGLAASRLSSDSWSDEDEEMVEILDLRFEKGMAREFASSSADEGILPGYHMNKNNWITVVLDYGVATEEVLALIDKSYQIVAAGE